MSHPLKDAVIGCNLIAVDEDDMFYRIHLPTGELGWAQKKYFGTFPDFSADAVINLAKEFLGYQYFWGGKTPKGFDCSGFVQTVFSLLGKQISRDAWMQAKEGFNMSNTWDGAHASDLLFFGNTKDKIIHVGISLGNNKFIHALGWVKINSLSDADSEFSRKHVNTFILAKQTME
ncbi:MAG: C40 family peptidase, partial [Thermodesulfobacteriota bacterium]